MGRSIRLTMMISVRSVKYPFGRYQAFVCVGEAMKVIFNARLSLIAKTYWASGTRSYANNKSKESFDEKEPIRFRTLYVPYFSIYTIANPPCHQHLSYAISQMQGMTPQSRQRYQITRISRVSSVILPLSKNKIGREHSAEC